MDEVIDRELRAEIEKHVFADVVILRVPGEMAEHNDDELLTLLGEQRAQAEELLYKYDELCDKLREKLGY